MSRPSTRGFMPQSGGCAGKWDRERKRSSRAAGPRAPRPRARGARRPNADREPGTAPLHLERVTRGHVAARGSVALLAGTYASARHDPGREPQDAIERRVASCRMDREVLAGPVREGGDGPGRADEGIEACLVEGGEEPTSVALDVRRERSEPLLRARCSRTDGHRPVWPRPGHHRGRERAQGPRDPRSHQHPLDLACHRLAPDRLPEGPEAVGVTQSRNVNPLFLSEYLRRTLPRWRRVGERGAVPEPFIP